MSIIKLPVTALFDLLKKKMKNSNTSLDEAIRYTMNQIEGSKDPRWHNGYVHELIILGSAKLYQDADGFTYDDAIHLVETTIGQYSITTGKKWTSDEKSYKAQMKKLLHRMMLGKCPAGKDNRFVIDMSFWEAGIRTGINNIGSWINTTQTLKCLPPKKKEKDNTSEKETKIQNPKNTKSQKCEKDKILNPKTNRCVKIGSATYKKLVKEGVI